MMFLIGPPSLGNLELALSTNCTSRGSWPPSAETYRNQSSVLYEILELAAALIASMQILGVTLIAAALIIPAITARLLTDSFNRMSALSTLFGAFSGLLGIYLSYYIDIASGASIVLFQAFRSAWRWSSVHTRSMQLSV